MTKPKVWISADGTFMGSTGTASVEEFADAIVASSDLSFLDVLIEDIDNFAESSNAQLSREVVLRLNELGVRLLAVPRTFLKEEQWDYTFPVSPEDWKNPVAVGLVKVMGVDLP